MNSDTSILTRAALPTLIILGAALRFYDLGAESLWLDEALSWQQARLPFGELLSSVMDDVHPPLYALILHAFISLFGDSEWVLRLPSAICGTLSIWLTWSVCVQLKQTRAAPFATALWVISLFAVRYSQEARMYALMSCLALASMLLLIRLNSPRSKPEETPKALAAGYILISTLLLYTHVFGIFILLAQNLFMVTRYLIRWPNQPALPVEGWLVTQAAVVTLFLPWLPVLFNQTERVQTVFWLDQPGMAELVTAFTLISGVAPALYLILPAVLLGGLTLISQRIFAALNEASDPLTDSQRKSAGLLLGLWLLIPVLVPFLISQIGQPIFIARYIIAAASAWFILAAIGITAIRMRWLRYSYLLLLALVMGTALPFYYSGQSKTDWRALVNHVEENAAAGDLVLFHSAIVIEPYRYYAQRDDLNLQTVVAGDMWQADSATPAAKPDVRPQASQYQQVWLVSGYDVKTAITETEIVNQLVQVHTPVTGLEFSAMRVFRFGGDQPAPAAVP